MMTSMINYFVESSIILGVLYLLYFLLFRKYKNFQFNRGYLILSMCFGLLIPLLSFSLLPTQMNATTADLQQALQLPSLTIIAGQNAVSDSTELNMLNMLLGIYLVGVGLLLVRFLIRFSKIFFFIRARAADGIDKRGYALIPTDGKIATCSFFRYLLWDNSQEHSEEASTLIMKHEETHIRHGHSYDILFAECLIIVFWFNPLAYWYRSSLSALHEYIADEQAASLSSKEDYISLLSLNTLKSLNLTLGNNFYQTQIFNRMMMLKTEKKRSWWSRIALTAPVFAMLFYVFACSQKSEEPVATDPTIDLPAGITLVDLNNISPEAREWFNESAETILREREGEKPEIYFVSLDKNTSFPGEFTNIRSSHVYVDESKEDPIVYMIVEKTDEIDTQNDIQISNETSDEIFTMVEEQPIFKGGTPGFYQYISENLEYPEQAQVENIQGRVYVQFVINKEGVVEDVVALKGIGGGCDEAAVSVVESLPKWTPGKQRGKAVKVRMVLPVEFKLDAADGGTPTSAQ